MHRHRGDEGFSVAEVVIAAAIMFFVLTALVGLMGVSSSMSVQAKQKTALVNTVASVIDEVRATNWAGIDTAWAGSRVYYPEGENGPAVTVTIAVETKNAEGRPYLKVLTFNAATTSQGRSHTYETRVAIRNPDFNQTLSNDPDAPSIQFVEGVAPAEDEVLFAGQRHAGGAIVLRTKATAPADPIAEVSYEIAGQSLPGGSQALFTPYGSVFTYEAAPTWDTREVGDGFQNVTVTVKDARYRSTSVRRRYIIDNHGPLEPGTPSATAASTYELDMAWGAARDGGTGTDTVGWQWAYKYVYEALKEPVTGASNLANWTVAASGTHIAGETAAQAVANKGPFALRLQLDNPATPPTERTNGPFSRYVVRVTSAGVRTTGASMTATSAAVTAPELICNGTAKSFVTVSEKSNKYTYDFEGYVTAPAFPSATTPSYAVQYKTFDGKTAPTAWTTFGGATVVTTNGVARVRASRPMANKKYELYDFRVVVSNVQPTGALGGVTLPAISTNVARMATVGTVGQPQYLVAIWGQ